LNFYKLLENGSLTAVAFLRKFERKMVVTKHVAFMFVVRILRPKYGRTYAASEMLEMELLVEGRNV
jgi:hypothetical protein